MLSSSGTKGYLWMAVFREGRKEVIVGIKMGDMNVGSGQEHGMEEGKKKQKEGKWRVERA